MGVYKSISKVALTETEVLATPTPAKMTGAKKHKPNRLGIPTRLGESNESSRLKTNTAKPGRFPRPSSATKSTLPSITKPIW